jgi:hypothetical protein
VLLLHFFRRRGDTVRRLIRTQRVRSDMTPGGPRPVGAESAPGGYIKSRVMTLGVLCPTHALHQDGARKPGVSVSVRDPQWLERVRLTRFILVQRLRFGTDSLNPSTPGVRRCRSLLGICDKLGVSNHVELVRSGLREEESADDECVLCPAQVVTDLAVASNVSVRMRNPG